jgi:hypothetical protein
MTLLERAFIIYRDNGQCPVNGRDCPNCFSKHDNKSDILDDSKCMIQSAKDAAKKYIINTATSEDFLEIF